ncbi:MAG: carboxypeptidase regulatory-like domain-containing protein [Archangiaceae bacterium]|nr:carboxypeptidase regulatory-like domain-containing protein [Archangiaceae bacterium]
MEVGFRGVLVAALLLAVLGGAIAYSLWPETDGGKSEPAEEHHKSLDERLAELEKQQGSLADAGVAALEGDVRGPDGRPVPAAEVWVTAGQAGTVLEGLSCEVCGAALIDCAAIESAREVLQLARAGKLTPKPLASTRTDAAGHFRFESVPATGLEVRARAPGLDEGSTFADPGAGPDDEDGAPEPVVVLLSAPQRFSIAVVDADEKPVRGARVTVLDRERGTVRDLTSDDRGQVELVTGADAMLWLLAEAPGYLPTVMHDLYLGNSDDSEEGTLPTVRLERPHRLRVETRLSGQLVDAKVELTGGAHPHRLTAKGGVALFEQLASGSFEVSASYEKYVSPRQAVELDEDEKVVRVDLRPAARLSVGVVNERGEPISDARVTVDGYGNSDTQDTDESGALVVFENLAEGSYQVHVEKAGRRDAQRRVDVHAGDNHLEVALEAASMLAGKVVDAEGKPVPGATVELVSQIHEASATTTSDEGTFELQVDEPGTYRVRAKEPQLGQVVAQVTAPDEQVVLKLEPLARIEVHVLAEHNPLRGTYVSVFGVGAASDDSGTAVTDDHGVAKLAGLRGGEYLVNVEQTGFQRAEPRSVTVAPNARVEVTINLERGVEISGRVIDEQGRPVVNADVHTVAEPKAEPAKAGAAGAAGAAKKEDAAPPETFNAYTDESGDFTLEGLKPGHTYALAASSEEKATRGTVKVKAPASGVTLKLEALPGVKGRVLDEKGQPVQTFRIDGKDFDSPDGRFVVGREPDADGKLYLNVDADGFESLSIEREPTEDVGDLTLKKSPLLHGTVIDARGQPVAGAEVTCDQCIDSTTSGSDGAFSLQVSQTSPEPTVTATRLSERGKTKASANGASVVVKLEPPVRVEGVVKDPTGKPVAARITVREINGGEEERLDSGPDGRFELDLPEGLWMFITRMSATGQTVRVVPPKTFVTLGAPPGTCAVTITVSEPVGDAWLVPGEPAGVPLDQLDDDGLYAGAVALDLPLPNRPIRSAGLQCGVYTLITTDSSGVRRERVDVRTSESTYVLPPAPPGPSAANNYRQRSHPKAPVMAGWIAGSRCGNQSVMHLLLVLPLLSLGQLTLSDGDKEVRLGWDGLTLKSGSKEVQLSGAGAVGKSDGGTAFTGIAQSKDHACREGEDIDVGGTNNHVTLTGRCGAVTVAGIGNQVTLESASEIEVDGRSNTVSYRKGEPKISKPGAGAQVFKLVASK